MSRSAHDEPPELGSLRDEFGERYRFEYDGRFHAITHGPAYGLPSAYVDDFATGLAEQLRNKAREACST
ncbi:hypothetical protein Aph01nite_12960 [Acrocarpospora phusangensis]|uniref:Uncharacterized protein n=1 Tax=Acrocarpospora phusangensis TaxID=1070424 RepID=A0A919Q7I2_9ACTN|nr:hypothetical protein [Acrocarpospora phusangensis]GIH22986.1 hypothetical protein Aph01nite_12960 [Acrocarpospora phusangensis]